MTMTTDVDGAGTNSGAGSIGASSAVKRLIDAAGRNSVVLCDGAMGTMLYARGVFINKCYDELNLSQPEMVRTVHAEYLQAGAELIETNTFGANAFRLERYGLKDKVREINVAGVRLARECVKEIEEKQASHAVVAGAIGPLGVRLEPLGGAGASAGGGWAGSWRGLADCRDDDFAGGGAAGDSGGEE
jgi:methionine synthase I (cobalamin-dependent)